MATISIGKAWEETLAFVKREGTLLFPVALVFLALPMALLEVVAPNQMQGMGSEEMKAPTQLPPQVMLVGLLAVISAVIGVLASYALALKPGISVSEALQLALRRIPVLFGSGLLVLLAYLALSIAIAMLLIPAMGMQRGVGTALLLSLPFVIFVGVRLLLLNVVVLNEPVGVIEAIRRSWALTAGQFGKLVLFALLFVLLITVAQLVASSLLGVVGGLVGGPSLAALFAGLAGAVVAAVIQVYYLVMTCRIYIQLAG